MIDEDRAAELIAELQTIPDKIEKHSRGQGADPVVRGEADERTEYVLYRSRNRLCGESGSSLKMKEISYIHSEPMRPGSWKHGKIS